MAFVSPALFLLIALLCGCQTMDVPEPAPRSLDTFGLRVEKRGLTVAVDPRLSKQDMLAAFGVDLASRGLVPILVALRNDDPNTSFILDKQRVAVVDGPTASSATASFKPVGPSSGEKAVNVAIGLTTTAVFGPLGLPLLAAAGMKSDSDELVIRHILGRNALYSHTLDPGESTQGYLYVQHPDAAALSGSHHVLIEVFDADARESITFDLPIP